MINSHTSINDYNRNSSETVIRGQQLLKAEARCRSILAAVRKALYNKTIMMFIVNLNVYQDYNTLAQNPNVAKNSSQILSANCFLFFFFSRANEVSFMVINAGHGSVVEFQYVVVQRVSTDKTRDTLRLEPLYASNITTEVGLYSKFQHLRTPRGVYSFRMNK